MDSHQQFFLTCDGIKINCKLDLPPAFAAPGSAAPGAVVDSAAGEAAPGSMAGEAVLSSVPDSAAGEAVPARIPLVIVVCGLTGYMEEPHVEAIAEALPKSGYATLRVELYGHGKSGGRFHDHTLFHWALELMDLIDWARKLDYVSGLYLSGHSQGAAAAVLGAGLKPDVLDGLLLLAPAMVIKDGAKMGGFPERFFDPDHIPDETVVMENEPISGNYYRVNRLLPFDDAVSLYGDKPVLVIHSRTDELVPYRYGEQIAAAYSNSELFTIDEDDHCFATHIDQVTGKMIEFLSRIRV